MAQTTYPLSMQTYHHLLNLGLSSHDVDRLMALIDRPAGCLPDGVSCRAALEHAAQGGDPVALKLSTLSQRDPTLAALAMAYAASRTAH